MKYEATFYNINGRDVQKEKCCKQCGQVKYTCMGTMTKWPIPKSAVTLKRMESAYASVCSYARILSQTLIYVRRTVGIRRVRSEYADIRRCTLCYTQRPNYYFWTCSKFISVCERI